MLNKLIVTAAVVALALGSGLGFGQHVASASSSKNFSHFFDGPGATYVVMSGTFGYDGYSNVWDLSNGGSCVFSGSENGNWNLGQEQPGQQKGSFYFTDSGGHTGEYWCNVQVIEYNDQHQQIGCEWMYPRVDVDFAGDVTYKYSTGSC